MSFPPIFITLDTVDAENTPGPQRIQVQDIRSYFTATSGKTLLMLHDRDSEFAIQAPEEIDRRIAKATRDVAVMLDDVRRRV